MIGRKRYPRPLVLFITALALLSVSTLLGGLPKAQRRVNSTPRSNLADLDEEQRGTAKLVRSSDGQLHDVATTDEKEINYATTQRADAARNKPRTRNYHGEHRGSKPTISKESVLSELSISKSPLCSREQIRDGSWVPLQLEKPPYISITKHLRCYPRESYDVFPWNTWAWLPLDTSCEFTTWNTTNLCDLLRFGTLSIIGDSLNWEMYSSLLQLLGVRVLQSSQHKSKTYKQNHATLACNGRARFIWRNDARLENVTDSIRHDFPSILVLNRGAHFKSDTELLTGVRYNIKEVQEWLKICDERQIKCHFFWRTSVPGHPGCGNFTKPVNDIVTMEARVADLSLYNNRSINYHWYDYQHQNKLVLKELEKSGLDYHVIDAYELNMRRPDEHRAHQDDCLHSCYPGKMDVYNQLLLHFLKMNRTEKDVLRMEELFRKYLAKASADKSVLKQLGLE